MISTWTALAERRCQQAIATPPRKGSGSQPVEILLDSPTASSRIAERANMDARNFEFRRGWEVWPGLQGLDGMTPRSPWLTRVNFGFTEG
jgi:hypothetical protein